MKLLPPAQKQQNPHALISADRTLLFLTFKLQYTLKISNQLFFLSEIPSSSLEDQSASHGTKCDSLHLVHPTCFPSYLFI